MLGFSGGYCVSWTKVLRFLCRMMSEATEPDSVRGAKVAKIKLERVIAVGQDCHVGEHKEINTLVGGTESPE